jgi:hypothetical protein
LVSQETPLQAESDAKHSWTKAREQGENKTQASASCGVEGMVKRVYTFLSFRIKHKDDNTRLPGKIMTGTKLPKTKG